MKRDSLAGGRQVQRRIHCAIPRFHGRQARAQPRRRSPCPAPGGPSAQQRYQFFAVTVARHYRIAAAVE
eukprot:1421773-Rhodomonas_salina.1